MTLRDLMAGKVPETLIKLVPKRFDVIGDVAVISIPPQLYDHRNIIATELAAMRSDVRTVLNKVSKLDGEKRVASFETLLGDDTVTTHREYKYIYRLDVSKMFFNSRLGYERNRVASEVKEGESVIVPFCGVGPFAIPAAGNGAEVIAVEKNAQACRYLADNLRLNKIGANMHIIHADAFDIPKMLKAEFDRAIVPTPYGLDNFLWTIEPLIREGGTIHFYTFKTEEELEGLIKEYEDRGLETKLCRKCGNVAPGVSRWAFDLVKRKNKTY